MSQFLIINLFENTQTHPIDSVCLENPDSYSEGPREVKSTEADSGWRAGRGETACVEWIVAVLMDCCLVIQLCPTLYDPVDYSLLDSSVHGILQEKVLERLAIPFSRGSPLPRDRTWVSGITGRFFTN